MSRARSLLAFGALAIAACTRPFDPASQLESLRIVAVRADQSLPAPGTDVTLEMIAWDASPLAVLPDGTRRPVELAWLGGCADPDGDLYYQCGAQLTDSIALGPRFTWHVPEDVISRRSSSKTAYGISYVFYAACAGKVVFVAHSDAHNPPLACLDAAGTAVGADGFVFGYVPLYSYPSVSNTNPVVNGGAFDGATIAVKSCGSDADCPSGQACASSSLCVPIVSICTVRTRGDCPSHDVKPAVDAAASTEADPVASYLTGTDKKETIYVEYYASEGDLTGSSATIVDAAATAHDDYDVGWRAPDAPGEARVWAIVRDDRGGVSWWWQDVVAR